MEQLIRTDRNGTKYYEDNAAACGRCGGSGFIRYYGHVEGGRCFRCGGDGTEFRRWVVRTPEYEAKLADKRLAKARREAPAKNAELFSKLHFAADGSFYAVAGKTFDIKDELKAAGAHYLANIGWFFTEPNEKYVGRLFTLEEMSAHTNDFTETDTGRVLIDMGGSTATYIKAELKKMLRALEAPSTSEYIGEAGSKIEVTAKLVNSFSFSNDFGYYGGTTYIYKFMAGENVIVWKTSSAYLDNGKTYDIKGTIKEHSEYNGTKQTVLTRCKVTEVLQEAM